MVTNFDFCKIVIHGRRTKGIKTLMLRHCSCGSGNMSVVYNGVEVWGRVNAKVSTVITCNSCGFEKVTNKKAGVSVREYNIDRDKEDSIVRKYFTVNLKKDSKDRFCMYKKKMANVFPCICNPHNGPQLLKLGTDQYVFKCSVCEEITETSELPDGAVLSWNSQIKEAYKKKNIKVEGA